MTLADLSRALRARRQALGLTQQQLADLIGWHQTEISELERGDHPNLRMDWLVRVGRVLGLSPNELASLAGWWDEPPREDDPYLELFVEQLKALHEDRRVAVLRHASMLAKAERLALAPPGRPARRIRRRQHA